MDENEAIRRIGERINAAIESAFYGGAEPKIRRTALRLGAGGRGFETVELDADGKVIEPPRCTCRGMIVLHMPPCPFAGGVVA